MTDNTNTGRPSLVGAAVTFLASVVLVGALSLSDMTIKPISGASAATSPGWAPWLADLNGLWTSSKYGNLQIFFSPQRMLIKSLARPMALEILATDSDNETVTFHISFNVNVFGQEVTSAQADEWTIQRAWNADHTRFGLFLNSQFGQEELGFVRELLPKEEAALVTAQSVQEPQTKPSYYSAGAAIVSGDQVTFHYIDAGMDGALDLKMSSNDTLSGQLNTVHKTSTNVCNIEMEGIHLDRNNSEMSWSNGENQCSIRIKIGTKSLAVSGTEACETYCGAGGRFQGDYYLAP